MNDGAELATAGLVAVFAALLLVASHLFIEFQFREAVRQALTRSQNNN